MGLSFLHVGSEDFDQTGWMPRLASGFSFGFTSQSTIFSHVGTEPPIPGYYQYFLGGKCILLKDTTWRPE